MTEAGVKSSRALALPLLQVDRRSTDDRFTEIYREHYKAVRSVLYRLGARDDLEDLVQDVFLRVHSMLDAFRGEASLRTWIIRIAINAARDLHRRRQTAAERAPVVPVEVVAPDPMAARAIEAAMAALSDDRRTVFVLCVIEQYTMSEAATILSVPEGTVKSRLFDAKHLVRESLQEQGYMR
jgi:RNA polymerase sigma-70 factor (ECF subfamily)